MASQFGRVTHASFAIRKRLEFLEGEKAKGKAEVKRLIEEDKIKEPGTITKLNPIIRAIRSLSRIRRIIAFDRRKLQDATGLVESYPESDDEEYDSYYDDSDDSCDDWNGDSDGSSDSDSDSASTSSSVSMGGAAATPGFHHAPLPPADFFGPPPGPR